MVSRTKATPPATRSEGRRRARGAGSTVAARTGECSEYLSRQLLTYLGNKRALLAPIAAAVEHVERRLGRSRLRVLDAFSGSGIVSRFLKAHAGLLISNDLEEYAAVTARCFLRNASSVDAHGLADLVADLNARVAREMLPRGFIAELYAPRDEQRISAADRVFYTPDNARRIDDYRRLIDTAPADLRDLLLGPLLSRASVHANTAGVFKGFYKDRTTKIGRFGGSGADALLRIRGRIELEPPVLSRYECECAVYQEDANTLAPRLRGLDLVYVDPPYNQHPYGSNYFMLNLIARYQRPATISPVAGIPTSWQRSGYNVRGRSLALLRDLLTAVDAPFLLISFNDEGFIRPEAMRAMLAEFGAIRVVTTPYNAFRGSRNLSGRPLHVTEQLFLVERR